MHAPEVEDDHIRLRCDLRDASQQALGRTEVQAALCFDDADAVTFVVEDRGFALGTATF